MEACTGRKPQRRLLRGSSGGEPDGQTGLAQGRRNRGCLEYLGADGWRRAMSLYTDQSGSEEFDGELCDRSGSDGYQV